MRALSRLLIFTGLLAAVAACAGCASPEARPVIRGREARMDHRASTEAAADASASESGPLPVASAETSPGPAAQQESPDGIQPASEINRLPYTAPGLAFRQLAVAAVAAIVSATPQSDAAEAQSESLVFSSQGSIGRLGVTAPPTSLANAVVGRPGTVRGPATGLGFASPGNNLFSAGANAATGVNGRCGELARAGFFGGSRPACERAFRR